MKKKIVQNENGRTEICFGDHVVKIQFNSVIAPPNVPLETFTLQAFSNWMKLDDDEWIMVENHTHEQMVEKILEMNENEILKMFKLWQNK